MPNPCTWRLRLEANLPQFPLQGLASVAILAQAMHARESARSRSFLTHAMGMQLELLKVFDVIDRAKISAREKKYLRARAVADRCCRSLSGRWTRLARSSLGCRVGVGPRRRLLHIGRQDFVKRDVELCRSRRAPGHPDVSFRKKVVVVLGYSADSRESFSIADSEDVVKSRAGQSEDSAVVQSPVRYFDMTGIRRILRMTPLIQTS